MRLLFKQRFFSWFDSYDIYDEDGNTVFTVEGKLAWGHCLHILNAAGEHIGTVQQRVLTFLPKFELYIGKLYYGRVVRLMTFGAFVELAPGKDGLVHISKLADKRIEKVEDACKIGDMMWVKVTEIDEKGRVNLSHKDAMKEIAAKEAAGEPIK